MGGHLVTRGSGAQVEAGQGRGHQAGTVGVRAEAGVAPIQTAALGVSEIMNTQCPLSICWGPPARSVSSGTGSRSSPSTPSARVTPGPDFLGQILIIAMQFSATGEDDQSSCNNDNVRSDIQRRPF